MAELRSYPHSDIDHNFYNLGKNSKLLQVIFVFTFTRRKWLSWRRESRTPLQSPRHWQITQYGESGKRLVYLEKLGLSAKLTYSFNRFTRWLQVSHFRVREPREQRYHEYILIYGYFQRKD